MTWRAQPLVGVHANRLALPKCPEVITHHLHVSAVLSADLVALMLALQCVQDLPRVQLDHLGAELYGVSRLPHDAVFLVFAMRSPVLGAEPRMQ